MADVEVRLKLRGINALMTSQPVVSAVARRANAIRAAAGDGFKTTVKVGSKYTAAYVQTDTDAARKRQAEDAVLQKALDAGRS